MDAFHRCRHTIKCLRDKLRPAESPQIIKNFHATATAFGRVFVTGSARAVLRRACQQTPPASLEKLAQTEAALIRRRPVNNRSFVDTSLLRFIHVLRLNRERWAVLPIAHYTLYRDSSVEDADCTSRVTWGSVRRSDYRKHSYIELFSLVESKRPRASLARRF